MSNRSLVTLITHVLSRYMWPIATHSPSSVANVSLIWCDLRYQDHQCLELVYSPEGVATEQSTAGP